MEPALKQRLVGAAVLVALAMIFLPMLVKGPAPDSGVSDVSLDVPDVPGGQYETRELPLVEPAATAPAGGALDMQPAQAADAGKALPTVEARAAPAPGGMPPADLAPEPEESSVEAPAEAPAKPAQALPATTAGGDYAVNFGSFANAANADAVLAAARAAKLPAYREATTIDGQPGYRVRIGPYATRAEAEIARLRAEQVRADLGAVVVALDAGAAPPASARAPAPATTAAATATKPAATASQPAPAPAATGVGFAVQLAAYSKPSDALALRDKLRAGGFSAFTEQVTTDKGVLTRVRVGPVVSRADAEQLKAQVRQKFGLDGIVRPHP